MGKMQPLFDIAAFERAVFKHESERPAHFCRTCEHREPWQCGSKIIQYCRKLKSNRTDNEITVIGNIHDNPEPELLKKI